MKPRIQHCTYVATLFVLLALSSSVQAQGRKRQQTIPHIVLLKIVKAEDERRWGDDLRKLMTDPNAIVRSRAALAAGRIGDEGAIPELSNLLANDKDQNVRAMSAFAIGEVESVNGATALLSALSSEANEVRARAIEGLGKIAAALPREEQARQSEIAGAILDVLTSETKKSAPDRQVLLLGATAVLRSRPTGAGKTLATLLSNKDPRVRADAGNALARLRLKDGNAQLVDLLSTDPDGVVRSNAARILGATEEKSAYDRLIISATQDKDARVRVSAIRALTSLKDPRAAEVLLKHGAATTERLKGMPAELNELLEISTALGRLLAGTGNTAALDWLNKGEDDLNHSAPELDLALVRISPDKYLASFGADEPAAKRRLQEMLIINWRAAAAIAQALREVSTLPATVTNKAELMKSAQSLLQAMLDVKGADAAYGMPEVLRAYAAYKPSDLPNVLHSHLDDEDVIVRGTAADLLGELPPSDENTRLLATALPRAMKDALNDAALSIVDSIAKQKTTAANDALKTALQSNDRLVRQRAAAALKANGAGDFSAQVGTVQTRNKPADYQRALSRIGKPVRAIVTTTRGSFTIELLPEEAPLTVDNFVQLAKRGYYRGIVFHRVVPNFVIQDGDPRGDGNGGPGYSIRCEVNGVPYDRGAVGMALSGKDTGGSQWFVTHAPQPHLDGGYTVFGKVISGMNVVDSISRGDVIRSISVR